MQPNLKQLQSQWINQLCNQSNSICGDDLWVSPLLHLNTQETFAIYQNNLCNTLIETLKSIYPVGHQLVGEACFKALAHTYLVTYPSYQFSLNGYGDKFPEYANQYLGKRLPYLQDLLALEWAVEEALIGLTPECFDFQQFTNQSALAGYQCLFYIVENATLLHSKYPIDAIWQAHQQAEMQTEINLDQGAVNLMIWANRQGILQLEQLSIEDYAVLQQLAEGKNKSKLSDVLLTEQAQAHMIKQLPFYIEKGWIDRYKFFSMG